MSVVWNFIFGDNETKDSVHNTKHKKEKPRKIRDTSPPPTHRSVHENQLQSTTLTHNDLTAMESGAITHMQHTTSDSVDEIFNTRPSNGVIVDGGGGGGGGGGLGTTSIEMQNLDKIYFDPSDDTTSNNGDVGTNTAKITNIDKNENGDTLMSVQDVAANLEYEKQLDRAISHSNHILTPREQQRTFMMLFQSNNAFDYIFTVAQIEQSIIRLISYREDRSSFDNVVPFMQYYKTTHAPIRYTKDLQSSLYTDDEQNTHLVIRLDSLYNADLIQEIFLVSCEILSLTINLAIPIQLRYLSYAEQQRRKSNTSTLLTISNSIVDHMDTTLPVQLYEWNTYIPFAPPQGIDVNMADDPALSTTSMNTDSQRTVNIPHVEHMFHFESMTRDLISEPLASSSTTSIKSDSTNQKYFLRKNKLWAIYVVECDSSAITGLKTCVINGGGGSETRECLIQRNLVSVIILKTIMESAKDTSIRIEIAAAIRKASVLHYRMTLSLWHEILKYVEFNCIRSKSPGIDIILRSFNGDHWVSPTANSSSSSDHHSKELYPTKINANVGVDIKFRVFYKDKK